MITFCVCVCLIEREVDGNRKRVTESMSRSMRN